MCVLACSYIDLLWFLPDIVMLLSSVVLFVILRALTKPLSQQVVDGADEQPTAGSAEAGDTAAAGPRSSSTVTATVASTTTVPNSEVLAMRKQFGTFLALVSLLLAAAVRPSLPSAVYFLVFLGASTWWACFKELDR